MRRASSSKKLLPTTALSTKGKIMKHKHRQYAAIGTPASGRGDPIIWGLGKTAHLAMVDAVQWILEADMEVADEDLNTVCISDVIASAIEGGIVDPIRLDIMPVPPRTHR